MNTEVTSRGFRISHLAAAVVAMAGAVAASAPATAGVTAGGEAQVNHYVGSDGNWFDPRNWSLGRVPGEQDTVVLDGNDTVVIDPEQNSSYMRITLQDVLVSSFASLETRPGTVLEVGTVRMDATARLVLRESALIGGSFIGGENDSNGASPDGNCPLDNNYIKCVTTLGPGGYGSGGVLINPSTQSHRDVILKTSMISRYGLGGTTPASVTGQSHVKVFSGGAGHYATTVADTVALDGELELTLHYGFQPQPGDSFQIITAKRTSGGRFLGIPEGGYVGCSDGNVALRLTYAGGDGNDVVVTAEQGDAALCLLLPAVQRVREAAARAAAAGIDTAVSAIGARPVTVRKPPCGRGCGN